MHEPAEIATLPGRYALYAQDLVSQQVAAYHANEVFASASLIKVPIMVEIFRQVEEAGLNLDQRLTLSAEDQVPGSGVLKDLTPGQSWSLRDLTTLMITVSDNTATNLLIDFIGVDRINATQRQLGLLQTQLVRRLERIPTLRPTVNATTAHDMSRLMMLLARGECISRSVSERMVTLLTRCQGPLSIAPAPRPAIWAGAPTQLTVAHKTGSLEDAFHDSGIVYGPHGQAYVATILSQGVPAARLAPNLRRIGRAIPRWLHR